MKPQSILKLEKEFNMVFRELIDENEYTIFENTHSYKVNKKGEVIALNLSEMRTNDFLFVKRFKESLIYLDLSNNYIEDTSFINRLNKIKYLSLKSNRLTSISSIKNMVNLEYLNLRFNMLASLDDFDSPLSTIECLKKFSKLKFLDLRGNNIQSLETDFIISLRELVISETDIYQGFYNDFSIDPSLLDILRNENKDERVFLLESYDERRKLSGTKLIRRVKLILIGNTQAGKTTLADIFTKQDNAKEGSTHGVNFFNCLINEIEVKGYDFGGQDYYHNTHYTFFDENALYLIVWGNGQENKLNCNDNQELIFPLEYWLGSLERFKKKKDINNQEKIINLDYNLKAYLIQNFRIDNNKKFINQNKLKNDYKFLIDFRDQCFIHPKHKKEIQEWFEIIVKEFLKETEVLVIDYDIANSFLEHSNQKKVILTFDEIRKLQKRILNYNDIEIVNLIKSLHKILACFYVEIDDQLEMLFNNKSLKAIEKKVIVNIEQFTKWIYLILNKEILLKEKEGYFSRNDAIEWLLTDVEALIEIDYILAFMIKQKIIFNIESSLNNFFAPNYLRDKLTQAEINYLSVFEPPLIKYELPAFFHTSILSDIINEYYNQLVKENNADNIKYLLWKNRVVLYEGNNQNKEKYIYIHFDITPNKIPVISISKLNSKVSDVFLLDIMNFIDNKIKSIKSLKYFKTPNGNYIPEDVLNETILYEDNKKSTQFVYQNMLYNKSDFKIFLNKEEKLKLPMKKIFISYSHKDIDHMNDLLIYLKGLERNAKIEKWTDLQLNSGVKQKQEILKNLDQADIVILLISQYFIASDFINDNELPLALKKKVDNRGEIVLVYLSECTIFDIELDIKDKDDNVVNVRMSEFYFSPQDEKNNLKPIEEWEHKSKAWKKVYEEVKKKLS